MLLGLKQLLNTAEEPLLNSARYFREGRQKKTDSRVAELEKKINGLEAILPKKDKSTSESEDGGSYDDEHSTRVNSINQSISALTGYGFEIDDPIDHALRLLDSCHP